MLCEALGDEALAVREPGGTAVGERVRELAEGSGRGDRAGGRGAAVRGRARRAGGAGDPAGARRAAGSWSRTASSTPRSPTRATRAGSEWTRSERINRCATGGLLPDLTILLSSSSPAPPRSARACSIASRTRASRCRRPCSTAYEELAAADPARWRRIDADRPSHEVHADVLAAVRGSPGGGGVTAPMLAGTEDHAHARMVLGSALESGAPSHAYLFHGPPGTGKRTAARALAAELLAEGDDRPRQRPPARAARHAPRPDLGAAHGRARDAGRGRGRGRWWRPPRARRSRRARRVFVLERVDTMNDEVANRLLKTLEEPASFVHLILLTDSPGPGAGDRRLALPARALRPAARRRGSPRRWRPRACRPSARAPARGCRSATPTRAVPGVRGGRGAARRRRRASCADALGAASSPTSPGAPLLERAEERRDVAEQRGRRGAQRSGSSWSRKGRERSGARARVRGDREARRPPRAHGGARPRR